MDFRQSVVVVGGGIAGLSAAYHAQKLAREAGIEIDLAILEAEPYWGGKIVTDRVDGFVIEGGPDTFLATKPWAVQLCRELEIDGSLQGTNPHQKNTYVLRDNRLAPIPEGLMMMIPSRFGPMIRTPLLTWPQKTRMGLDFLLPPRAGKEDESVGSFVTRRLGRAAYERLIEPLLSGIYAGDGDQLSLQSTFPTLRDLELKHGGLIKGALAARKSISSNGTHPSGFRSMFLTPRTGLAEMVESLVEHLRESGARLRSGVAVTRIDRDGESYRLSLRSSVNGRDDGCLQADRLILATPAFATGEMLASIDPDLSAELQSIEYASTATVSLAYKQEDLPLTLDGYGYVIPRREGRKALACTWTSTKFPHRAPEGYALLRVFIGRAGQDSEIPWEADGLRKLAEEELRQTLGVTIRPQLARTYIWEKAMPQYNLGHPERLDRIDDALRKWQGMALAGNGYRGIGIPDCIHSGELAARRVLDAQGSIKGQMAQLR